jgi:Planctomycete cytochrome C
MNRVIRAPVLVLVGLGLAWGALAEAAAAGPPRGEVRRVGQKRGVSKKDGGPGGPAGDTASKGQRPAGPGGGELSFQRDIAPILVANCAGCHNAKQKRGKLDMSTFQLLMQGTPAAKVIVGGKPGESHLVLRIKGEETPKMPQGGDRNLSADATARIERWVAAGARLDAGLDPKAPMVSYAASPEEIRKSELAKLPPDARDKQVEEIGRERWRKASPKATPEVTPGAHFLLFSTLSKPRAAAALKTLEAQYSQLRGLVGPGPLEWAEKASLFVFNDRASLVEFVRTTANREAEHEGDGIAVLNVPQPYVAVLDPLGGRDEPAQPAAPRRGGRGRRSSGAAPAGPERTLAGLLTEQFAGGILVRAGKAPRWLSLGLGAQMAARVEPRSPYYHKLRQAALELYTQGWPFKATEALGDSSKTADARAVGFAVLDWLSTTDHAAFAEFIKGMSRDGEKLDEVIHEVLNGTREEFLNHSGAFVEAHYGHSQ